MPMVSRNVLGRRALLGFLLAGLASTVGCGDPDAGTVEVGEKGGAPARLKRLEQLKDEAASKKKKSAR